MTAEELDRLLSGLESSLTPDERMGVLEAVVRYWHGDPATIHVRTGAFMLAAPNGVLKGRQGYSVFLGAKNPEPLAFLREIIDHHWDHVAIDE